MKFSEPFRYGDARRLHRGPYHTYMPKVLRTRKAKDGTPVVLRESRRKGARYHNDKCYGVEATKSTPIPMRQGSIVVYTYHPTTFVVTQTPSLLYALRIFDAALRGHATGYPLVRKRRRLGGLGIISECPTRSGGVARLSRVYDAMHGETLYAVAYVNSNAVTQRIERIARLDLARLLFELFELDTHDVPMEFVAAGLRLQHKLEPP